MKENKKIKRIWDETGFGDLLRTKEEIKKNEEYLKELESKENHQKETLSQLEEELKAKKKEIALTDETILLQDSGIFTTMYDFESSEIYKQKLEEIREKQKKLIKDKSATTHSEDWTVDGSKQKGKVMNNNNIKLTLTCFNNECDAAVSKVKHSNVATMEKRIRSMHTSLNKKNKSNRIEITTQYLNLKIDELYLAYEYQLKKEEEKEEQREERERLREEAVVRREIELERQKIEKEELHFKQELNNLESRLLTASTEEKELILEKKTELENKLELVSKDKENVFSKEQNTRAGYVYIISNIGAFGQGVYKIGMTRRLEPMDRVKELGDASVPFIFDVHAMIFSEDAPALESKIHRAFEKNRVNLVNKRKEFFKVPLSDIESVVKAHHNKVVEFNKTAEADDYRKTMEIKGVLVPSEN